MINLLLRMFYRSNCEDCPPGCVYCSKTRQCKCEDHKAPRTDLDTPAARFAKFCHENEGAIECRIYED